jgi:hypothetical protein
MLALLGAGAALAASSETPRPAADAPAAPAGKVNVWTYHNNNARTGLNDRETVLTPDLVRGRGPNGRKLGELWSVPLDGLIYAQPLVLTDVPVAGRGQTDLVIVATQHNSVFAFDAAAGGAEKPVWHFEGGREMPPVPCPRGGSGQPNLLRCYDILPEVGITGTPVIDPQTQRLYVVLKCNHPEKPAGQQYAQYLCCLDLRDGHLINKREVQAQVPGSGKGFDEDKPPSDRPGPDYAADAGYDPESGTATDDGTVRFIPKCQNQRAGLLLVRSGTTATVYVCWAAHGDMGAYHGWLIGFDADTLDQTAAFCTSPNGYAGSIWQGGAAPAADEQGNIFLVTGNGSFTPRGPIFDSSTDWGNCALKISTRGRKLRVLDYFSPSDRECLNRQDLDFGSGGIVLIPPRPEQAGAYDDPLLMVAAGKSGTVFLIDRERMGQAAVRSADNVFRRMPGAICEKYGIGAYFDGSLYLGGGKKKTQARDQVVFGPSPIVKLPMTEALDKLRPDFDQLTRTPVDFPDKGTTPSISANGAGGAILWALKGEGWLERANEKDFRSAKNHYAEPAVLYAFDAHSLDLLWASDRAGIELGDRIKFTVPTVANGRVFVGTGVSPDGKAPARLTALGAR